MDPDEDAASSAEPNASVDASLRNVATTASRVIRPAFATPCFRRVPALQRLDSWSGNGWIRPRIPRTSSQPLPVPVFAPTATRIQRPPASPLPAPVFRSNRRSQPYPSTRPAWTPSLEVRASPSQHVQSATPVAAPLASRPVLNPPIFRTQKQFHCAQREIALRLWRQFCFLNWSVSPVLAALQASKVQDIMLERLIRPFADSTLLKYLPQLLHFYQCILDLGIGLDNLSTANVLDVLWSFQDAFHWADQQTADSVSALSHIKALRWGTKLLQLPFPDLFAPPLSVLSYAEHERKEAMPLPASIVFHWEECIHLGKHPLQIRLFMGAALTCIWSSLRFADAQHVRWTDLILDDACVRGLSFRTKTSRSGVSFGVRLSGLASNANCLQQSWIVVWIKLLDDIWSQLKTDGPDLVPDCLFVHLDQDKYQGPLSYCQALKLLRHCVSLCPSHRANQGSEQAFTLHSMKSTFLSWLAQLNVPPADRAAQGHHTFAPSVRLYSRDDVFPSLRNQKIIHEQIRQGWRPATPQSRGGQPPVLDMPFDIPPRSLSTELHLNHFRVVHFSTFVPEPASPIPTPAETSGPPDSPLQEPATEDPYQVVGRTFDKFCQIPVYSKDCPCGHCRCLHEGGIQSKVWRPHCISYFS